VLATPGTVDPYLRSGTWDNPRSGTGRPSAVRSDNLEPSGGVGYRLLQTFEGRPSRALADPRVAIEHNEGALGVRVLISLILVVLGALLGAELALIGVTTPTSPSAHLPATSANASFAPVSPASVGVGSPLVPGNSAPPVADPRSYLTDAAAEGAHEGFTPIARGGESYFARVISATPGKMDWWRFATALPTWGGGSTDAPYFANSAGATSLRSSGTGNVASVPSLIRGIANCAVSLSSTSYLDAFDYWVNPGTDEILSVEFWFNLRTDPKGGALIGQYGDGAGWMVTASDHRLTLRVGDAPLLVTGAIWDLNQTYHVVVVIGGEQLPTPDYVSRIYVNGVDVARGFLPTTERGIPNESSRFEIGSYANGAGDPGVDMTIDEVVIYNRMLQPNEVAQHYNAGIGLTWP
jgi:hypothetical protein